MSARQPVAVTTRELRHVSQPVLQVVIASTRPGRVGGHVADWFVERARVHGGFEVEVVDLAEVDLPLLDEPNHPRLHRYTKQHTLRWSETISRGDAYVFVMPEYNYGINAALKNAIDYLFIEWQDKAVSFVSYGGVSGGLRAVQMLKQVISALKMVPTQDAVVLPFVRQYIDEAGGMSVPGAVEESATALLDELARLTGALRTLRTA